MTLHNPSYKSLPGPIFMVALLVVCIICSCRNSSDPRLVEIDTLMESNPDSALTLLKDYTLTPNSSSSDSAYFALLLTQARYKTFIDETDDSLISVAVDWFERHKDTEKATRALFLQGMVRLNAQRFGDAAVSFSKGLDIAHAGKHYLWEGQCARGLCIIYGKIHDGSAQVEFAKRSYDSFLRYGDEGWINYSLLNLATAYINNCKYSESLTVLDNLEKDHNIKKDTPMLSEIYQMKGLIFFALRSYTES